MRKILFIFSITFTISMLYSCDSLLEVEAENTIGGDVFTSTAEIERALNGAYFNLGGIASSSDGGELLGGDLTIMSMLLSHVRDFEIMWDNFSGAPYLNFQDKDVISTNSIVLSNWSRAYETINLVNNILANIENVTDLQERNRIQGEALAIRGILYFEMVRLWAPQYETSTMEDEAIPLRTEPVISLDDLGDITNATVSQVYERAENDLAEANQLLASFGRNGIGLSSGACLAYLAKIAIQKNDFTAAVNFSDQVINSNQYSLTANYSEVFNNSTNSTEDIFAIQQNASTNSGNRSNGTGITTFYSGIIETGFGTISFIPQYIQDQGNSFPNSPKYRTGDLRGLIDATTDSSSVTSDISTPFYFNATANSSDFIQFLSPSKYLNTNHVIPILRLAEMYLIRAEAQFELNFNIVDANVVSDLNETRTRAGLSELTISDFASPDALFDSIVVEKNREFFLEGHLLHDLKRRRVNLNSDEISVGDLNPLDSRFILPIPQEETDASGID